MRGLVGTLSSSDYPPDRLAGVAGLLDKVYLPLAGFDRSGDGRVVVGKGLVALASGDLQRSLRSVDGFAHKDRMTQPCGLVQLTCNTEVA